MNQTEHEKRQEQRDAEKQRLKDAEDTRLKAVYDSLAGQYTAAHGEVTPAAQTLLEKAAYLEMLHEKAQRDLEEGGLRESYAISTYRNGTRESKALGMLIKIANQQTKLLRELRLLPGGRKQADNEDPDGDDEPEHDIDDY